MSIRVVIVDDEELVREGFAAILDAQDDIAVVGQAADGREAIRLVRAAAPDVVLMDVRMPGMDGLEAARVLLDAPDHPCVVILTTFDRDDYVYDALRAGASGFLLKDAPKDRLLDAVRRAHSGDSVLAPAITRRLIEEFVRHPAPGGTHRPGFDELSERELEILRLIAGGHSNREIAEQLYLSEATVKSHVGSILTKLRLRDRLQAAVTAYQVGLVSPGDDRPRRSGR